MTTTRVPEQKQKQQRGGENNEAAKDFLQKVNLARMYQLWGRIKESSDLCSQALNLVPGRKSAPGDTATTMYPKDFVSSATILHGVLRAIGRESDASFLTLAINASKSADVTHLKASNHSNDDIKTKKKIVNVKRRPQSRLRVRLEAAKREDLQSQKKNTIVKKKRVNIMPSAQKKSRPRLATRLREARKAARLRVEKTNTRKAGAKIKEKAKRDAYAKMKSDREEQLKKFREAAAARNRERARKKREQQSKEKAEAKARMKRLEELQNWLDEKKEEQRNKHVTKATTVARAPKIRTFARAKLSRQKVTAVNAASAAETKAPTTTISSQKIEQKKMRSSDETEVKKRSVSKRADSVGRLKTASSHQDDDEDDAVSFKKKDDAFDAGEGASREPAKHSPSSMTKLFSKTKPCMPSAIRRTISRPSSSRHVPSHSSSAGEPATRTVRDILNKLRTERVADPRTTASASDGTDERRRSPKKKAEPDTSNRARGAVVDKLKRGQPQEGMVILRRRSDRHLRPPSTRASSSKQAKRSVTAKSSPSKTKARTSIESNKASSSSRPHKSPEASSTRRPSSASQSSARSDGRTSPQADSDDIAALRLTISQRLYNGTSSIKFYSMNRILGKGNFGVVRLGNHKLSGEQVAIKFYDKSKFRKDRTMMKQLKDECRLMEKMNHPNVTRLFETFSSQRRMYMVMEFVSGGSLIHHMRTKYAGKAMPEKEAWRLFPPLFEGLNHIHTQKVCHRDIKLDNILLDRSDSLLKFTDFGFSTHIEDPERDRKRLFCGTPAYMAPELIRGGSYRGFPVDIWAMGVVLYAVVCGRFPFMAKYERALYKKVVSGRFSLPSRLSKSLREFLKGLLCISTRRRLTMEQCLDQPWLRAGAAANATTDFGASKSDAAPYLMSKDPREDISEVTLRKMESFGFRRDPVRSAVLRKERNQFTTAYYLTHARTRSLVSQRPKNASVNVATKDAGDSKTCSGKVFDRVARAMKEELPSIRPNRSKSEPAALRYEVKRRASKSAAASKGGIVILTGNSAPVRKASTDCETSDANAPKPQIAKLESKNLSSKPRPKPVAIKYIGYYRALKGKARGGGGS